MSRRGGIGVGTVILVIVSLLVVVVGAGGIYLAMTNQLDGFLAGFGIVKPGEEEQPADDAVSTTTVTPALVAYAGYTWPELQDISNKVAAASSDADGIAVAASYGLCDASGAITSNATQLVLSDNTLAYVQLVGIRQDQRADGSGVAGLTFMAYMVSEQPMSSTTSCAGGWEASSLRAWCSGSACRPSSTWACAWACCRRRV